MKLLDTNIVVYAVGHPHEYKYACVRILQDVAEGAGYFNIDTELLQEVLYLYTVRAERTLGLSTCNDLLLMFPNPFPITREEIVLAHELLTGYPNLLPRDAIHAAVVRANHMAGIVSADRVFDTVDKLNRFDPLVLYPEEHFPLLNKDQL